MTASQPWRPRAGERAVVVHIDDIGMCADANAGALRALAGAATCGSVMVPCPGFAQIAQVARERPELDLGVHLTLNCEYERFRWKPVRPDVPSLCAPDGGLLHTSDETGARASHDDLRRELRAQIELALESGIDVTHLDAHMGTALRPEFAAIYVDLASEYRLPAFIPRITLAQLTLLGMAAAWDAYRAILEHAERVGLPLFDHFDLNSLAFEPGTGLEHNRRRVEQLQPGITYLITHVGSPGTELEFAL